MDSNLATGSVAFQHGDLLAVTVTSPWQAAMTRHSLSERLLNSDSAGDSLSCLYYWLYVVHLIGRTDLLYCN